MGAGGSSTRYTNSPPANSRSIRASVPRSSWRGTIMSTRPKRKFDSERPKSSGSCSRVVCCTTRRPANAMNAPGSAMITSPSAANEAITPPVLGWESTEMNGMPASFSASTAQVVFAICIRASTFSCMRAPPDEATDISGIESSSARSTARANFSPTTEPIEPPTNSNSIVASAQRCPSISARPTTIASSSPVAAAAAARRSG